MKKIAVLGPKGTYSDIACRAYLHDKKLDYQIEYYPSILEVAKAMSKLDMAIFPFENTLDGFVVESMDQIILHQYHIVSQIKLDIDFVFVSNAKAIEEIKNCYVQFKAYGQCLDFISKTNFNMITTQSNTESLFKLLDGDHTYGAIIPIHLLKDYSFNIEIKNIADSRTNETRFFIVQQQEALENLSMEIEASFVITAKIDRPGILFDILKNFHDLNINLKSIMSRPMKTEMGQYKFYIECSLQKENRNVLDQLEKNLESKNEFLICRLGIYNKL